MKKIIIALGLGLSTIFGFSQSNYISLQGGYHLGLPHDNLNSSSISYAGSSISADGTQESRFGTLGKGVPVNLAVGHMFNDFLGVELGFNYLFGSNVLLGEDDFNYDEATANARTSQFRFAPQLVLMHKGLYSKVGFMIPVTGKTTLTIDQTSSGVNTVIESEVKGHPTIGYTATIGYEYSLNEKMGLFAEAQYISLSLKSKTSEITRYEVNGTDVLNTIPDGAKNTEYVDELALADQNPISGKALAFKRSYSSLGINIGVKYKF